MTETIQKKKLLIVDDEPQIRVLLKEFLSEAFLIELASNGKEALSAAKSFKPDVILMDIMMPELDGVSAVQKLRLDENTRHIPVLMLTAANTSQERIRAFDFGADDFISKPFEVEELVSRINAKLNRVKELRQLPPDRIEVGNLVMDLRSREVTITKNLVDLAPVEFGILLLLLLRLGTVVSRKEIMKEVWQDGRKSDRLIDAHVTSLRKKIDLFDGDLQTVYGEGYRMKMAPPPSDLVKETES
ncbi:MAG: response regulator transcription factor [Bdellovibrionales bacterium]|nr:response regulator transcription factor [Oligoflexia bacterium]